jgi:hypothetical protein
VGTRGLPSDMMLVYVELPDFSMQLFLSVPDPDELLRYRGFEPCPQPSPSRRPKLLMGDLQAHALFLPGEVIGPNLVRFWSAVREGRAAAR